EWPLNRSLDRRLRRAWRRRLLAGWQGRKPNVDSSRMVEYVPRELWTATQLDTAEDVGLLEIDSDSVTFFGEHSVYHFPAASLIDAQLESVRPKGCFHQLHFIVITARTETGPTEFPIALRDYSFGQLASPKRRADTNQICTQIQTLRQGFDFSVNDSSMNSSAASVESGQVNPYAAPSSTF
ncbi:MAG: hypothetical protein AAFV88_13245, partial [Planctomycetota bacterium]